MDYFGTSSPAYELSEKFVPWRSAQRPLAGWLAVSAAILKVAQGRVDPALGHRAEDAYEWLRGKEPGAGTASPIFVFDLRHGR